MSSTVGCVMCQLSAHGDPRALWQFPHFVVVLDAHPVTPGHVLIVPKRHLTTLEELDCGEWEALLPAIVGVQERIPDTDLSAQYRDLVSNPPTENAIWFCRLALEKLASGLPEPVGWNVGVNQLPTAGQSIPHLHVHVIPQYGRDRSGFIGTVRGVVPGMMDYKKPRQ